MKCSDISKGTFSEAEFLSSKIIQTGGKEARVEYDIRIMPLHNMVQTSRVEFSPNINKREPIDLAQYRITAEIAMQIAEKNGGTETRLKNKNACQIDALAPGPDGKGWRIMYLNINNLIDSIFEIFINPQTGAFTILKSTP